MWTDPYFTELFLKQTPFIDVRAPVEFADGHIPGAINLPLMVNEERHQVGICYKEQGQDAAIKLGHELVSGATKDSRINAWVERIRAFPATEVYCFRGGLRSQISCQWIRERGIQKTQIPGGYKAMRRYLLSVINEAPLPRVTRVGGLTGTGKTDILEHLTDAIDLEGLAYHRGSIFGDRGAQPAQATFENHLAVALIQKTSVVLEDESYSIGRVSLPNRLFEHMRNSPMVIVDAPMEERIQRIHRDYVLLKDCTYFITKTEALARKLGGLRARQILDKMTWAFDRGTALEDHAPWIEQLLAEHYDPMYAKGIRSQEKNILFRGTADEVIAFLSASKKY